MIETIEGSGYRVVSMSQANVTCTSLKAPLMPKEYTEILGTSYAASRQHLFQGRLFRIFQKDNAKPHTAHIKKAWLRV